MSEESESETTVDTPVVDASSIMAQANVAAERLEKANAEALKIVERQEALHVKNTLDGIGDANIEKPKVETPKEYADKVMRGDV